MPRLHSGVSDGSQFHHSPRQTTVPHRDHIWYRGAEQSQVPVFGREVRPGRRQVGGATSDETGGVCDYIWVWYYYYMLTEYYEICTHYTCTYLDGDCISKTLKKCVYLYVFYWAWYLVYTSKQL